MLTSMTIGSPRVSLVLVAMHSRHISNKRLHCLSRFARNFQIKIFSSGYQYHWSAHKTLRPSRAYKVSSLSRPSPLFLGRARTEARYNLPASRAFVRSASRSAH